MPSQERLTYYNQGGQPIGSQHSRQPYHGQLKEKDVEIYFEKETIWATDSKGDFLITIMLGLALEERRSISENCTCGQRKRFADGKGTVPFNISLAMTMGLTTT